MKNLKSLYLLLFALMLSSLSYGQQQRALTTIQENVNKSALGLEQRLNYSLDTLTLRSTSDILRVTFLDHTAKDSHIIDVGAKEIKIPLYHFKKGRYTIAVYTQSKIIALGANRLSDIPVPDGAVADLEESILRSSLTDDQLAARNIKPREKKKPKVAPKPEPKVAVAKPKPKQVAKEKKPKAVVPVKDKRVAVAKPKPKAKKKKRGSKGKSAFAAALEKKKSAPVAVAKPKPEKKFSKIKDSKDPDADKQDASLGTLLTVKKVTYNLTNASNGSQERQTREEYRANNLRPNGLPYD